MKLFEILLVVFLILGIIALVESYYPIIMKMKNRKNKKIPQAEKTRYTNGQIEKHILVLKGESEPEIKAAAFVGLMELSYVLVHVLGNVGENYDDELQSERFQRSLTVTMLKRLNAVEGRYE